MKINKIEVNNYKTLVNLETPDFGRINFIHGLNNSGKSNLLEFLELIFKSGIKREKIQTQDEVRYEETIQPFWDSMIYSEPFIFHNDVRDNKITYSVEIIIEDEEIPKEYFELLEGEGFLYKTHNTYPFVITGEIVSQNISDSSHKVSKVSLCKKEIYDGETNKYFNDASSGSSLEDNSSVFNALMEILSDSVQLIRSGRNIGTEKVSIDSIILDSTNFKKWLFNLSIDSQTYQNFNSLVEFLNKFEISEGVQNILGENVQSFPFQDTEISFSTFEKNLEVMLKNRVGRFPLSNFGTGIQQIFYILASIFNTNSKVIIIEELELNLSPEYQEILINNLIKLPEQDFIDQIFFTSHSDYLFRGDYKTYEVSINEDGHSSIGSQKYDDIKKLRREHLDTYRVIDSK